MIKHDNRPQGGASNRSLRIGYIVNQYPTPSHTFITNEIAALECHGMPVTRIGIRGWDRLPLSEIDAREQQATHYLLQRGIAGLLGSAISVAVRSPAGMLRALSAAWRLSRSGGVSLARNLVYLAEACRVADVIRTESVTHLHAHFGTNPTAVAMLASALTEIPFSFTVHGPEEFDRPLTLKLTEKIRAAAFVVAISSYGRSQLYRWAELRDWPKVKVVGCGLDDRFLAAPATESGSGKTFVCVGRLCEQKGQLLLLQAFAALLREEPAARLVLAGGGPMQGAVGAEIARLGLGDAVRVTGWISNDEVRSILLSADALVLASFAEGLPVVLMEALALGTPVITTCIAGIPELIRHRREGLLIPAGDVAALTEAMLEFLRLGATERNALSEAGRTRVAQRHSAMIEASTLAQHFAAVAGVLSH